MLSSATVCHLELAHIWNVFFTEVVAHPRTGIGSDGTYLYPAKKQKAMFLKATLS